MGMSIKSKQISYGLIPLAFGVWGCVSAGVPHTFQSGNPALASEVNENFDSLDTRLTAVESQVDDGDYSGFFCGFSPVGSDKNVVVLAFNNPSGTGYWVRSSYANSTETVMVNGVQTVRPYIANYVFVGTDTDGNVTAVSNQLEAPDTADYDDYYVEISNYNTDGSNKQVQDSWRESLKCGGSRIRVCVVTKSSGGSYISTTRQSRVQTLQPSFTQGSNNWTFNSVRVETDLDEGNTDRMRIRAKGIGEIFRTYDQGSTHIERSAIYYRVNGNTKGSLAGTPFDTGQPLEGLFF